MTRKKNDEDEKTAHRVVEVSWLPRSSLQWATFTAARRACGDLWSAMVAIHKRIRRLNWKWPSRARWEKWAKGKFQGLSAQSIQQTVAEFCECLSATTAKRKAQKGTRRRSHRRVSVESAAVPRADVHEPRRVCPKWVPVPWSRRE